LDEAELLELASLGEWQKREAGDILFRKGEPADALYLVCSGRVVEYDDSSNSRRPMGVEQTGPGGSLGADSLLTGQPFAYTAVTPTVSELFVLGKRPFYRLLSQHPQIVHSLRGGPVVTEHPSGEAPEASPFPASSEAISGPREITAARLRKIPLFSSLSDDALQQVAALFRWEGHPAGTIICQQGEPGGTLYLIHKGVVSVRQADIKGIERPLKQLGPDDSFGETSLLTGEPRDATIRALQDVELYTLDKEDFEKLLETRPDIRRRLNIRAEVQEKLSARRFSGLEEGELPVAFERKHPFILVQSLSLPFLTAMAAAGFLGSMIYFNMMVSLVSWIFLALFIPWLTWIAWLIYDWYNDDYIVTDRRVIHVERILFFFEERHEAPLEKIQNINTITPGPIARWLNFHDLIIQTAGKEGSIVFKSIPRAEMVADLINQQKSRIHAPERAAERERMRQALREEFGWANQLPDEDLSEPAEEPEQARVGRATRALAAVADYFLPRLRIEEGDTITWRKHWFVLLTASWKPVLLLLALIGLLTVLAIEPLPVEQPLLMWLITIYLLALAAAISWLWWQYEDWRNDIYVLTNTDIKDIDRQPLWLHQEVRQASLGQVQDVRYEIPSPIAVLLKYGNVLIETAGKSGILTFTNVSSPAQIQEEIFRRIQRFERNKKRREWADRRAEMIHALGAYQEVLQEREETSQQG
jgi:CRP-like cAMP-binding protein